MNTFAIGTIIKNEHDYINQFIEHHLNMGFTFFYIIVDNLTYQQDNYKKIININFLKYVKLYDLNKNYNLNLYEQLKKNNSNTHIYWINYFNSIVLQEIKEDWILMIGMDSFLYLNGNTINDYMKDINDDIFQIAFPWLAGYNLYNYKINNFVQEINKLYFQNHNHTYGMGKTKNIKKLHESSHFFIPKTEQQIIYIPNDIYFKTSDIITPYDIFNKNKFNINNITMIFALHVQLRSYDEIIVKDLYSWNFVNDDKLNLLKNLITNDEINNFTKNTHGLRLYYILNNNCIKINDITLNIKKNDSLNTTCYNDNLINKVLEKINICRESYQSFLEKIKKLKN